MAQRCGSSASAGRGARAVSSQGVLVVKEARCGWRQLRAAALALRLDADHLKRYGAPGNYAEGVWRGGHTANGMAWVFIQPREAVRIICECS